MTNEKTVEIKLKRRTVKINLDEVKGLVNRDVTINEICEVFDNESYKKYILNNKKLESNVKISIISTMEQFIKEYETFKNPANKRQLLYSIKSLHNEDATPLERIEDNGGKPLSDLSACLEALVLISLKHDLLPEKELTTNQWLQHFGLVSEKQYDDYKKLKYSNDTSKLIAQAKRLTNDMMVDYLEDNGTVGLIELRDEHIQITLNNLMNSFTTLNSRLENTLKRLHKSKLIKYHDDYNFGVLVEEKKELTEEERYYEEMRKEMLAMLGESERQQIEAKERARKQSKLKVLLTPAQVSSLDELKVEVKEEIEEMKKNGEEVNNSIKYKLRNKKLRENGLEDEDGNIKHFNYAFRASRINKYFTAGELEKYLSKKDNVRVIYEQGVKEVVNKYNDLRLEHIVHWFDDNYFKQIKKIEEEKIENVFGAGIEEEDFKVAKRKMMQAGYCEFGKALSGELMTKKYKVESKFV